MHMCVGSSTGSWTIYQEPLKKNDSPTSGASSSSSVRGADFVDPSHPYGSIFTGLLLFRWPWLLRFDVCDNPDMPQRQYLMVLFQIPWFLHSFRPSPAMFPKPSWVGGWEPISFQFFSCLNFPLSSFSYLYALHFPALSAPPCFSSCSTRWRLRN